MEQSRYEPHCNLSSGYGRIGMKKVILRRQKLHQRTKSVKWASFLVSADLGTQSSIMESNDPK